MTFLSRCFNKYERYRKKKKDLEKDLVAGERIGKTKSSILSINPLCTSVSRGIEK